MNLRTFWDAPRPKFHDTIAILSLSLSLCQSLSLWAWKPEKIEDFSFVITRQRLLSSRKFIWNFISYQGWPMGYWLCSPSSVCKLEWIATLYSVVFRIVQTISSNWPTRPIQTDPSVFKWFRWQVVLGIDLGCI